VDEPTVQEGRYVVGMPVCTRSWILDSIGKSYVPSRWGQLRVFGENPAPVFHDLGAWLPGCGLFLVDSARQPPGLHGTPKLKSYFGPFIPLVALCSGYRQDETTRHHPVRSNHLRVPSIISALLSFSWEVSTAASGPASSCRPLPSLA
jgi:hypothetical protein